jgi:hypothetical protein
VPCCERRDRERFEPSEQVRHVLEDLVCWLQPVLRRFGLQAEDEHESDPLAQQSDALAAMYAGSFVRRRT